MQITKKLQRHTILLSVLLHLLLLLGFTVIISLQPDVQERPSAFIPSYVSNTTKVPPIQMSQPQKHEQVAEKSTEQTSEYGIKKPVKFSSGITKRPVAPSLKQVRAMQQMISSSQDPVHLLGDTKDIAQPLIILLGQALTKHLEYPKIAEDFAVRGVTLVGFTLHPDGHFTDVQLVKSSNADVLDHAALYAVNEAPNVRDANLYLKEPKYLVVGFVFR